MNSNLKTLLFAVMLWKTFVPDARASQSSSGKFRTLEGFVTETASVTSFKIGKLPVAIAPQASCSVRSTYTRNEFSVSKSHAGPLHGTLSPQRHATIVKTAPLACNRLYLTVGTRVLLGGSQPPSGPFRATRIVSYRVHFAVPGETKLHGLALLESDTQLKPSGQGWSGTAWIDGYPMRIIPQTKLIPESSATDLTGKLLKDGTILRTYVHSTAKTSSSANAAPNPLPSNTWVSYRADRATDGTITATQIRYWLNRPQPRQVRACCKAGRHFMVNIGEAQYKKSFAVVVREPDYAKHIFGTIQFHRGKPIRIVPDAQVQKFVTDVGMEMIPQYQKGLPDSDSTKIHFRFYVIRPFPSFLGSGFQDVNGRLPVMGEYGIVYSNPPWVPFWRTTIRDLVALPTGLILIPDSQLALIKNKAELAALLSCAITSVLQEQTYRTVLLQFGNGLLGGFNSMYLYQFILRMDQQALRGSLRSMLLAGYDLREAPYAWSSTSATLAQRWQIPTGFSHTPWYVFYSMNFLSRYYANVDYSALKGGKAEYQEFLHELRQADPSLRIDRNKSPHRG
jgi:hypothetical protein